MSKILFAVNGGFVHQAAEDALSRAGHSVLKAGSDQIADSARLLGACAVLVDDQPHRGPLLLCARLRAVGFTGALFLMSVCPVGSRIVEALDAGADDLLGAPLDVDAMLAKVRAAERRSSPPPANQAQLRLLPDASARFVSLGATKVRLTPIEARIVSALCQAEGALLPVACLLASASPEAPLSRASLQVHVAHIRSKLGAQGWRVQNCRAQGYRLLRSSARDSSGSGPEA
jgi:two-component system response regulator MprA